MRAITLEGTPARVEERRGQRWLAWAGIVGPILFTVTFIGQELFRRGEYSPVAEPVSALEAGPYGWVQQVNFVVFGVLTIAFAIGLHRGIRRTRAGIAGPALLAVSGIGALVGAAFPLREDSAGLTYDPGGNQVSGMTFFLTSALALIVLSRRLRHDERWRNLAAYVLGVGLAVLAAFPVMSLLVLPDEAPLHEWWGLAQRVVVLGLLFPCRIALSIRLLHLILEFTKENED